MVGFVFWFDGRVSDCTGFAGWVFDCAGFLRCGVPRLEQACVSRSRNYDTKWLGYLCRKGDFLFRGIVIDRADRRAVKGDWEGDAC